MMAIPAPMLSEVVAGLEKTHKKAIRYPIPTYLRYQPEVALSIPLSEIFWWLFWIKTMIMPFAL